MQVWRERRARARAWPRLAGLKMLKQVMFILGFLYGGNAAAMRQQRDRNAAATRRQRGGNAAAPPRERQLGPSGRRTRQEPFASRSQEKWPVAAGEPQ